RPWLASIASVSRLILTSHRQSYSADAWQARVAGENMHPEITPAPHPRGTTLEVRDLFFNTPARRKFLRTERTEFQRIEEVIRKISLSHADVSITLSHNGRQVKQYDPTAGRREAGRRLAAVFGQDFVDNAVYVEEETAGLSLTGWVGLPTWSRSQADQQFFYVNRRVVKDKLISHAVRQAYQDVLYHGRNPVYALFLEIEPRMVDVNVHPTKHEVRFRESRQVHDFVFRALHRALADVRPGRTEAEAVPTEKPYQPSPVQSNMHFRAGSPDRGTIREQLSHYSSLLTAGEEAGEEDETRPPLGYAVAQLHGIYILAENVTGLVLVAMHAAHARITYARMHQSVEEEGISS
ncbi:MAG: DNA mismatch repair protein MutL, partial [Pseudomonadales bacterium]|nr:DNA mismatch repair protein MutL [Pseudomonadales bacterium]